MSPFLADAASICVSWFREKPATAKMFQRRPVSNETSYYCAQFNLEPRMRSTLFFIPHEFAGLTVFGYGWLLVLLAIGCAGWIGWTTWNVKRRAAAGKEVDLVAEVISGLPIWGIAAALVVFVLPNIEQAVHVPGAAPIILGLPIRGYGVLVLIGLLSGIGLTIHRGRSLGISPDLIISLGFWMMLGGVVGARIFYVVQKWDEFADKALGDRIFAIVKLTEGGLVIYGGMIGGIIAALVFCYRHRQPTRAIGDLVAPAFLIGLAFGRIGCLMNGCCFGGICMANLPTIQFPQGSGPYLVQLESGKLLGIELAARQSNRTEATVASVEPGSLAAEAGVRPGNKIEKIQEYFAPFDPTADPAAAPKVTADVYLDQGLLSFSSAQLPDRSLPVHPSQIYAAINAALLCWLIWCIQPLPKRDGMTFLIAILLAAGSRFLEEGIRSDEGGQLDTGLSIAQWISLIAAVAAGVLILILRKTAPYRAWNWSGSSDSNG
jgi:phosphatidylglycerol---prolipoprotein diacylglyceryl transferase